MISLQEESPGDAMLGDLVTEVDEIFSEAGLLSKAKNFEYRAEQRQMAIEVARALAHGSHLVVEAGTGVGKSLAYLIPSVLYAVRTRRKALICTHTINLQEQLILKDIPLVQKLLPVEFEAALLMGRQNYLCGTRLDRALANAPNLFTDSEALELERLREWSFKTKVGTLSDFGELPDEHVWSQVASERHACTPKACGKNPRCFYQAARRRAAAADVLVLNHTLFFTLLGDAEELEDRETGFLFPHDFAVFDEAHTLEAVASKHLGICVSQYGLRLALQRLYNPRTKKGLFTAAKSSRGVMACSDTFPLVDSFFNSLAQACNFSRGRDFRVREPGIADASPLLAQLRNLVSFIQIEAERLDGPETEATRIELLEVARRLREASAWMTAFLEQQLERHVYWVGQTGKRETTYTLNAVPLELAALLRRILFREGTPAILTSATLSIGSPKLDYFRERVGAEDVRAVQIGSPFDYAKQMRVYLVRKMPDPRDPMYEAELEKWIAHFVELSRARAFVLFTSYKTMGAVAQRMRPFFENKNWDLFVQGEGMPRNQMLDAFRRSAAGVLFGTESFWTGVDVAGEALSNVIITRLPFATPDHPIIEAKLEAIEEAGGDPFQEYSLPEAILKLRQGVGRLIRSRTDKGIIVILDSRILTKPYGRAFLRALPICPVEIV
jgi:ATP-dependent DNA helicase DinG